MKTSSKMEEGSRDTGHKKTDPSVLLSMFTERVRGSGLRGSELWGLRVAGCASRLRPGDVEEALTWRML